MGIRCCGKPSRLRDWDGSQSAGQGRFYQAIAALPMVLTVLGIGAVGGGSLLSSPQPAIAVELSDGLTYFERPPSLVSATTNRDTVAAAGGTYYFTLDVPSNAGEPLRTVAIAQEDGRSSSRRIEFEAEESYAFEGTRSDRGEAIALGAATYDEDQRLLTVEFDPPVPPGTTITLAVRPERNPRLDGIYLLGVTAYPDGEPAYGQFLGYGRLHFYRIDYDWWR